MNQHTLEAKNWLDRRYSRNAQGGYLSHQPIYGLGTSSTEPNSVLRYARTYGVLEWLHGLEFDSVLDVGGGEGYLAALVRDVCGTATAHNSDLSVEACRRGAEIFGIQGAAADGTRLPFADNSYDVVVCSEVIEHLSQPVAVIAELARIARKYVVITTAEFCHTGETERRLRRWTLDSSYPHAEMNWFTAEDFRALMGDRVAMRAQYRSLAHLLPSMAWTRGKMERALALLTSSNALDVDHLGVILVYSKQGPAVSTALPSLSDEQRRRILDRLLEPSIPPATDVVSAAPADAMLRTLCCVGCRGAVRFDAASTSLVCGSCGLSFEVKGGAPSMFLAVEADSRSTNVEDEWVARFAAGDPQRERSVRGVLSRLHRTEQNQNPEWKKKLAQQLLRVWWLYRRQEPLPMKVKRLFGQLTGRPPLGAQEVTDALGGSEGVQILGGTISREGVSRS